MEDLFAMDEGNINNNNDLRCAEKPIYIHEPRMEQQKQGFIPANIPDIRSTEDPVLINDTRVLSNILARQNIKSSDSSSWKRQATYFENGVQQEIKSHMRKIVSDWMLEVCEEQQCQPEVFHLAIAFYIYLTNDTYVHTMRKIGTLFDVTKFLFNINYTS